MIKHTMALALTLTGLTLSAPLSAATQILDTNASWTVNGTVNPAVIPAVVPSIYFGGGANTSGGQFNTPVNGAFWIYPSAGGNHAQNTTFSFMKIFSLPAFANLSSAVLSGTYWSDNGIESIVLNGTTIFGPVSPATAGSAPTTTFSGGGSNLNYSGSAFGFANSLVFNVRNGAGTSGNPAALLADIQVAAAVPEPGTWMLMLLGFGAIGFAMRSRAKTQVRFQFA